MDPLDIGWIGTGVMGSAMCGHLMRSGHRLYVFNRTRSKTDVLTKQGAVWCPSPKAVAANAAFIFTMVGYPQDVDHVLTGPDGVFESLRPGSILVDMTTSSPALAQTVYDAARRKKADALDAPVSGGDIGAREATLAIMVGGDREIFDKVEPLFRILGKNIAHMGPAGAGQHTKMCNQILIAGTMIGTVESLLYAYRAGMDLQAVIDVIGKGAASSWTINNLGRRIADKDYNPGFFVKHFVKDMGIALAECQRMNLCLPGLALVHQFYTAAVAQGDENLGTQALMKTLGRLNGIALP